MALEALLTSTGIVALAEIGDKTQLLAICSPRASPGPGRSCSAFSPRRLPIMLSPRWSGRRRLPCSTAAGSALPSRSLPRDGGLDADPDKIDDLKQSAGRFGPFLTTTIAFFIVEMGDKTQIATIALGARFHDVLVVATGTTLGMMIANVPAVFLGHELLKRVPLRTVRFVTAGLFAAIGLWLLVATLTG